MAVKLIDELQKEIKAASEAVTQEAYEKAYDHVFQILDNLEKLLNDNRYLEGRQAIIRHLDPVRCSLLFQTETEQKGIEGL